MPEATWVYAVICLAGVFIASVSQVMLKKAALHSYKTILQEYLNPTVIIAYLLFFSTTILNIIAYRGMPLSLGPVLETTGYLYVTLFGALIFKEKLTAKKTAALALIIAGILIYSL